MDYKEQAENYRRMADRWEHGEQLLLNGELRIQDTRDAATAIEALLAERDAVVAGLIGDCSRCVYATTSYHDSPCNSCRYNYLNGNPLSGKIGWKWRGPQKEGVDDGQA